MPGTSLPMEYKIPARNIVKTLGVKVVFKELFSMMKSIIPNVNVKKKGIMAILLLVLIFISWNR